MKYSSFSLQNSIFALLLALPSGFVSAQSSCSSDGAEPLLELTERFINADCATCWTTPMAAPLTQPNRGLVLDWIVPSPTGDDAALSAAANRDATSRLDMLAMVSGKDQRLHRTSATSPRTYTVRVAHGLAVNSYVGTSIALSKRPHNIKKLDSFLLLLEYLPQGTAGSPVDRLLVRNMLQESWNLKTQPSLLSRRPMSIPAGTNPDNLRVVGWVQDTNGHVLAMAQSRCIPNK